MTVLSDRRFSAIALVVLLVGVGIYAVRVVRSTTGSSPAASAALTPPGGKLRTLPESTGFSVDVVAQKSTTTVAGRTIVIPIDATAPVIVLGWAVDSPSGKLASKIYAAINGTQWFACSYGDERKDVAKAFSSPAFEKSGYRCVIPANRLAVGSDSLALAVVDALGTGFYSGSSHVTLDVR
jgi:hypothetical protein